MKSVTAAALAGTLLVLMVLAAAQSEYKHQFIGATKCKIRHMSKKRGNQWQIWLDSKHAKAYEVLTADKADLAVENGLILPEKERCLNCHNKESPTYKPFDYDTFWSKIKHGIPEKTE